MGILNKIIGGVAVNGLSLYLLTYFVGSIEYTGGVKFFVIGGLFFGFINFFIKPIIKLFSLPFILLTGGLFLIVINALMLWLFSVLLNVIQISDISLTFPSISSYLIGALVFGVVNWVLHLFIK